MRMRYSRIAAVLVVLLTVAASGIGCWKKSETGDKKSSSPSGEQASVVVFFIQGETVFQRVNRSATKPGPEEALTELLKGPTAGEKQEGLATAIPEGTRLLEYQEKNGKATADFSKEMANASGGSAVVQAITNQINNTVLANDSAVKSVSIAIDGVPASEAFQP